MQTLAKTFKEMAVPLHCLICTAGTVLTPYQRYQGYGINVGGGTAGEGGGRDEGVGAAVGRVAFKRSTLPSLGHAQSPACHLAHADRR
jgi:hypothetical protein